MNNSHTLTFEDREEIFNIVKKFFNNINVESIVYGGSNSFEDYYVNGEYFLEEIAEDMGAEKVTCGVSKMVFFFKEIPDYVIKVPFMGSSEQDADGEIVDIELFNGAGEYTNNKNEWDYCETESIYFSEAQKYKVDQFFAGTYYLGDIQGHPFYCSEKVDECYEDIYYSGELFVDTDSVRTAKSLCSDYGFCGYEVFTEIIAHMISDYGEEEVETLLNFISKNHIDDFHSGNFGILSDHTVKIIDYSSWWG